MTCKRRRTASALTDVEAGFVREHGGVGPRGDETRKAVLRAASSNLAEQTRESLSVERAAGQLRVDGSRVRHRVLYAFKIGAGLRLPTWPFERDVAIPGLRAVLAPLPPDLHPLEVAGLMTTPDPDLTVADEPTSPRNWLAGGGEPAAVVELVQHLDKC